MAAKRKPKGRLSESFKPSATQLSFLPDNSIRSKRDPRLPDGHEEKRWAESEADRERKALERFLKRMEWTAEYWEMRRRHFLEAPLNDEELRSTTWKVEKIRQCGVSVEKALERQKRLSADLWMVAFLMAQGDEERDIGPIIGLKLRRVQERIAELREIVRKEVHADSDSAVTRWFLGH